MKRRGSSRAYRTHPLHYAEILDWADEHHARTAEWPNHKSGIVRAEPGERWGSISSNMHRGHRGMLRGYTLADFLAERRGVRNIQHLPRYTHAQLLGWADRHFQRTGRWPRHKSGRIRGAPGETWLAVDTALREGGRGLRGGSSLARLLADKRGVRNHGDLPRLSVRKILKWADAHQQRTGRWPKLTSGSIRGAPGETWSAIQRDLVVGCRGLPGGSSLPQLLAEQRGVRNRMQLPPLTLRQILAWADEHHERAGRWPTQFSGAIRGAPGETWAGINAALRGGRRRLKKARSLARLLSEQRGVRNRAALPRLTERGILAWARAHRGRHGHWPKATSGAVRGVPGQTWMGVEMALQKGRRGLPGGSTLHRLLARQTKHRRRA